MLSIAVIGAGRIGSIHARNIAAHPGARLAGVADVDAAAAARLAAGVWARARSAAGEAHARRRRADRARRRRPTPTTSSAPPRPGGRCSARSRSTSAADRVRACLAAVRRAGMALMIGFNRRFDPHFATLKRRLDAGEIGTLEMLTIISRDPSPPPLAYVASSGGLFRDMMIHDLDMARFLLGEEPVEVLPPPPRAWSIRRSARPATSIPRW